jgi:hypothetical protein
MHTERFYSKEGGPKISFANRKSAYNFFWFSDLPLMWRWRCADPIFIVICRLNTSAGLEMHTFSTYKIAYNALIKICTKKRWRWRLWGLFWDRMCSIFLKFAIFGLIIKSFEFAMCALAHLRNFADLRSWNAPKNLRFAYFRKKVSLLSGFNIAVFGIPIWSESR